MLWLLAGQFNTKICFLAQPGGFWALNCWRMTRTWIRQMVQSRRDEGRSWGHHILGCARITANTAVDVLGYQARLTDQKLWLILYCTNFLFLNDVKCWKPGKKYCLTDSLFMYYFRAWSVRSGKGIAPVGFHFPPKGGGA